MATTITAPDLRGALQATLGDAYVVERELGAGGMGRVFLATERGDGTARERYVAIKVLAPAFATCCDADRFRHEMAVVAALDHPHIVPLVRECDVCGGDRLFYFIMPYVEGESLRDRLDRAGALAIADTVQLLADVASALAYAHARGVVHRDIKPANVLVTPDGRALVTDFGIAKALSAATRPEHEAHTKVDATVDAACSTSCTDSRSDVPVGLTVAGQLVGTPTYAAPEQALGDAATDHRADLYALGVLAWETLVGVPPFDDASPAALIAAHVTRPPPPLPARVHAPSALTELVFQLLQKAPEDRPSSAQAVLAALEQIRSDTVSD